MDGQKLLDEVEKRYHSSLMYSSAGEIEVLILPQEGKQRSMSSEFQCSFRRLQHLKIDWQTEGGSFSFASEQHQTSLRLPGKTPEVYPNLQRAVVASIGVSFGLSPLIAGLLLPNIGLPNPFEPFFSNHQHDCHVHDDQVSIVVTSQSESHSITVDSDRVLTSYAETAVDESSKFLDRVAVLRKRYEDQGWKIPPVLMTTHAVTHQFTTRITFRDSQFEF